MKNKHGLSRHISEEVKLRVRQNSKFGCVVPTCRNSFYTYEHLDPEFKDCIEHNPENICLACSNHNPRRTGKYGQENYSKKQLIEYYDILKSHKGDFDIPNAVNYDFFSGFTNDPIIKIGESTFQNVKSIININGLNVFSFHKNQNNSPFEPSITFTGKFLDENGSLLFEITNNEWHSPSYNWDVQTTNGKIEVWDVNKKLVFSAIKIPNENTIHITKLDLWFNIFHVKIENDVLFVGRYFKPKSYVYLSINGKFFNNDCAILFSDFLEDIFHIPAIFSPNPKTFDEAFRLRYNGIWIGKGRGEKRITQILISCSNDVQKIPVINYIKVIQPPNKGNYFVKGLVTKEILPFPWEECFFWLNGQRIISEIVVLGKINPNDDSCKEHLFLLKRNEAEDFALNKGFVGFYADDILKCDFADNIFEVEVQDTEKSKSKRIKRFELDESYELISEIDVNTSKYYLPDTGTFKNLWKTDCYDL